MFAKINKFFSEVVVELKKVSWSTKNELIESTQVVLISSASLGVFIFLVDTVIFVLFRAIGVIAK